MRISAERPIRLVVKFLACSALWFVAQASLAVTASVSFTGPTLYDPSGLLAPSGGTVTAGLTATAVITPRQTTTAVSSLELRQVSGSSYSVLSDFTCTLTYEPGSKTPDDNPCTASMGVPLSVGAHELYVHAFTTGTPAGIDSSHVVVTVTSNSAPTVSISSPANGAKVETTSGSASFTLTASGADVDNNLSSVSASIDGAAASLTGSSSINSAINLAVGHHTISVTARDALGATATSSVGVDVLADAAPSAALQSPANGAKFLVSGSSATITVQGTGSDPDAVGSGGEFDHLSLTVDGAANATSTTTALNTSLTLAAGTHTIVLTATDKLGLTSSSTSTVTVTTNSAPTVSISSPANGARVETTSGTASFTLAASGADVDNNLSSVSASIDGAAASLTGSTGINSTINLAVGHHTISVTSADALGATATSSVGVDVLADAAPTATLQSPANGAQLMVAGSSATVSVQGTGSDPDAAGSGGEFDHLSLTVDGAANSSSTTTSLSTSLTLAAGTHTIVLTATDKLGLTSSATSTVTVTSDRAPTATLQSPANGAQFLANGSTAAVSVQGSGSDPDAAGSGGEFDHLSLIVDGAANTSSTTTALNASLSLAPGSHTIVLTATDKMGLTSSSTSTITVQADNPPQGSLSSPTGGQTYTFYTGGSAAINVAGTMTDPDTALGDSVARTEVWLDGVSVQSVSGGSVSTTISSSAAGSHAVKLHAFDSSNMAGDSPTANITITVLGPMTGNVDGESYDQTGALILGGWACDKNVAASVNVVIYAGGPVGTGTQVGTVIANLASEAAVGTACGTSGATYRWVFPLASLQASHAGQALYVYGVSAQNGGAQTLLPNSGNATISAVTASRPVTVSPPNLAGGLAGTLPGTASVGPDGTSQYHIDLPIPPGTAGIVPQIGLQYASGTPAVMSGVGWSVSGLSEITRCPSTLAQDNGVTLPVTNSATDQFCLDGQRLIMISGTLGGNAEFRTEVESFSRVLSFGTNPDIGPDHWTVQTKSGMTVTYGGSTGNATLVTAARPNETTTRNFSWSIARSQDAHGNYVSYQYEANDGTGEHFPTQIRYTGNDAAGLVPYDAVNFIYGTRTDTYRGWAAGSLITRSHILQAIETRLQTASDGSGGTLVRHWGLTYTPSTVNGTAASGVPPTLARSLLQSIQDCDGAGNCLNPTTFTWTQRNASSEVISSGGGSNWGGPQLTLTPEDYGNGTNLPSQQIERTVLPIDVNGDGKTDLLYATNNGSWQLCLNTGAAFSCSTLTGMPQFDSGTFVTGDFNGDGKMDVFVPPAVNGTVGQLCLSTGTGFNCSPVTVPVRNSATTVNNWLALDLDGDGRDDLVGVGNAAPPLSDSYICLSTGTTLATCTDAGPSVLGSGLPSVDDGTTRAYRLTGDFNGDGRMDVLSYVLDDHGTMDSGDQHISDHTIFNIFYGSPTGFTAGPGGSAFPAFRPAYPQLNPLGDTNGDGYQDFMWGGAGDKYGTGPVGYFTTCHLTGGPLTDCSTTTLPGGASDINAGAYDFQDYDGTGVPVGLHPSTGTFAVDPVTGSPGALYAWTPGTAIPCPNGAGGVLGDFNGDGLPDSACYDSVDKVWSVTFTGGAGSYPDLLQAVTDGNGLTSTFAYKGLGDPTVYTNGSGTALPMKDVHGGQAVVSSLAVDAASSAAPGATLVTNYSYSGLRTHVTRRQSLGFEKVTSVEVATGLTTVTTYSQQFPTIGQPVQVTTSSPSRTLINKTTSFSSFATYPGVVFPYAGSSTTQQWDLDGSVLPTLSSQVNSIDTWGNITSSTDVTVDSVNAETFTTTNVSQFLNNATNWQIGLLSDSVITKTAPGAASVGREMAFTYDAFGALATQTTQPNEPALKLMITYTHDPNFGVITKQSQAWTDPLTSVALSRDVLSMGYTDPAWRLASTITNALGQTSSFTYDWGLGQPLSVTDPNNQTTTTGYDGFGRKTSQRLPDGTSTTWAYKTCVDTCGIGSTAKTVTVTQNWATISGSNLQSVEPSEVFHDARGRDVMSRTWNYAESAVYSDQVYDSTGNLQKKSNPQTAADRSSGSYGWTTYNLYDAKRRPQRIDTTNRNNSGVDSTYLTYAGLTTTTQDANGNTTIRSVNGLGKMRQVTDALNHTTSFGYEPFGNLVKTTDPLGNVNTVQLDHLGHKIAQTDLDLGYWTYVVDPRGLVRQQTDAKSQVTTISYDLLDRVTERSEADLDSRWTFDTAPNGVGKVAESYTWIAATSTKDYRRVYAYDGLSRVIATTTTLDWDYSEIHSYDAYGRLATVTHRRSAIGAGNVSNNPTGTGSGTGQFGMPEIQYTLGYNTQGDLSGVMRGSQTLWALDTQDARGRPQLETFGSGLMTATGYNAYTERLEIIQTGPSNGSGGVNATIQSDAYGYDVVGNMTSRSWLPATAAAAMSETFTYDPLNRLQTSQVAGLDLKNFTFDAIGNIKSKSNVGTYAYPTANTAHPHMLNAITGSVVGLTNPTFTYDANGNTQSGLNRLYAWSAANLPVSVDQLSDGTQASATLRHEFLYGPERQRTREIVRAMSGATIGAVQRTIYRAGSIEKEIDAVAGSTIIRTYLPFGLGYTEEDFAGASIAPSSVGAPAERYFHKDNLGSLVIVTDVSQAVLQRMAYDAWGRRRQSNGLEVGWQYLNAQSATNNLDHTGFTDQEQLDDLSLVHLNGRVYDPMTGRMTSPDPTIPDEFDLQSLNRASYVRNRPLVEIDPSGFADTQTVGVTGDKASTGTGYGGMSTLSFSWGGLSTTVLTLSRVVRVPTFAGAATTRAITSTVTAVLETTGGAVIAAVVVDGGIIVGGSILVYKGLTALDQATGDHVAGTVSDWIVAITGSDKKAEEMLKGSGANSASLPPGDPNDPKDDKSDKKVELKRIHPDETLKSGSNRYSYEYWSKQSTDDIVKSLRPGQEEPLQIKPDGRIFQGNTRTLILQERGFDINTLPREILR